MELWNEELPLHRFMMAIGSVDRKDNSPIFPFSFHPLRVNREY